MTIVSLGSLGLVKNSLTLVTEKAILAGQTAFVYIVSDNAGSDGSLNQHHSITGGHGVWTKLGEARYHLIQGTRSNVNVSLWTLVSDRDLPSGIEFVCSIDVDPPSPIASQSIVAGWLFDVDLGYALQLVSEIDNTLLMNGQYTSVLPSMDFTGMNFRQHLIFRVVGMESNNTDSVSASTGFSLIQADRSTGSSYATSLRGEFCLETSSGRVSNIQWIDNSSTSSIGVVFQEVYVVPVSAIAEILPENPVTETWEWKTDIIVSVNQNIEKRIALRISPRVAMTYSMLVLSETDRRINFSRLFSEMKTSKYVPFFQYASPLTAKASIGNTRIYFDTAVSDIRTGDPILIYASSLRTYKQFFVDATHVDGVTLTAALTEDFIKGCYAVPARECWLTDGSGFEMKATYGSLKIAASQRDPRIDFKNPLASPEIKRLLGVPVLHKVPFVDGAIEEKFSNSNTYVDNEIGIFTRVLNRTAPLMTGKFKFKVKRYEEPDSMNYWRSFLDELKGMRGSFYAPTWRKDFVVNRDVVELDFLVCDNNEWKDFFEGHPAYSAVQIQAQDGDIIYRTITFSHLNDTGMIIGLNLAMPDLPKWRNKNIKVSLMPRFRLSDDIVEIEHQNLYSMFELSMRTVNE